MALRRLWLEPVTWHWCMMCLFSFLSTLSFIYMRQITQLDDMPHGVAEKSPGLDLLKNVWFHGYKFGSQFNARLKTLEPSSAAGSHFHYSDVMSVMVSQSTSVFDCLPNHLFRHRSKKTSMLHITGLCEGNSPLTGEFTAPRANNAEHVSIWWRHHAACTVISLKECLVVYHLLVSWTAVNLYMSYVNLMQTFMNVIALSVFELTKPDYSAESQLTQWEICQSNQQCWRYDK